MRTIPRSITPSVHSMCIFSPLSDEQPLAILTGGGEVNHSTPRAVPTIQSFSLASKLNTASASSVSAAPQSLLKSLGATEEGSRSIMSNATSRESDSIPRMGGVPGEGGEGVSLVIGGQFFSFVFF